MRIAEFNANLSLELGDNGIILFVVSCWYDGTSEITVSIIGLSVYYDISVSSIVEVYPLELYGLIGFGWTWISTIWL